MIRYLVMGIKEFIQRATCPKCNNGILLPYSWKTCQEHDPQKRKTPSLKKMNSYAYRSYVFQVPREKALESDLLVYDENMHIIGYRTPQISL
jgi:hypothetical protein